MEGVNPFIKNNKHRMIMFLDELGVSKKKRKNSSCSTKKSSAVVSLLVFELGIIMEKNLIAIFILSIVTK